MVDIYRPELWNDFFVMVGGAAAVLTGLVFVALSLHIDVIARDATHRYRAIGTLAGFSADVQKIFRAMQRYGLIVADNGSDMYISGTYDTRWNNDVLNPAFDGLTAECTMGALAPLSSRTA